MSRLGNYSELDQSAGAGGPRSGDRARLLADLVLKDTACPDGSHTANRLG